MNGRVVEATVDTVDGCYFLIDFTELLIYRCSDYTVNRRTVGTLGSG